MTLFIVGLIIAGASRRLPPEEPGRRRRAPVWYKALVVVLIAFGFLALPSIGAPFLFTGIMLTFTGHYLHRPAVFWPPFVALASFVVGYLLVALLRCNSSSSTDSSTGTSVTSTCSNPNLRLALLAGLGAAVVAGAVSRLVLVRRQQ